MSELGLQDEAETGAQPDESTEEGQIPASANYRPADDENTSCAACDHFAAGDCDIWNAPVDEGYTCDEFESSTPEEAAGPNLGEMLMDLSQLEGVSFEEEEDGSLKGWKPILRTGTWKVRPGANGAPLRKKLEVTLSGPVRKGHLVLEELVRAFKEGAKQHVTIPLSHENGILENTGFIEDVRIVDDPKRPGQHLLLGLPKFTDTDVEKKAKDGTIANCSAGVKFDYVRKTDGKVYPQIIDHVCLTNSPWLDGLEPFGVELSEDEGERGFVAELVTDDEEVADDGDGEVYDDEEEGGEEVEDDDNDEGFAASVLEEELGLSADEIRERLRRYDDLEERMHVREVTDEIAAMQHDGVPPSVCKVAEEVMLADDGGMALLLSEDGTEPAAITASDIVRRVVAAVPRVSLSERVTDRDTKGARPLPDAGEELTLEERADDAIAFLEGKPAPVRKTDDEE